MPIILALSKLHGRIKRLLHRLSWAVFLFTLGICPLCVWSQVIDFDGMAPALGLHSSRTQEGFVGHLGTYEDVHRFTCGTDGAVVVYRSTDPTALNASRLIDGLHLWTFEAEGEINCKPLVAKGVVFFGSDGGYFYALDERTGQRLWKFDGRREESVVEKVVKETKKEKKKGGLFGKLKRVKDAVEKVQEVTKTEYKPNNLRTRPALKDDVIAVYVPAKKIVGLNYLTGEVIWEFELYEGKVPWYVSALPGDLYGLPIPEIHIQGSKFVICHPGIWAFDVHTGEVSYLNTESGNGSKGLSIIHGVPAGNHILASTVDSSVVLLDGAGGGVIWRFKSEESPWWYSTVYTEGDQGFALASKAGGSEMGGAVMAFNLDSGNLLWSRSELPMASRLWVGQKRVYLVHDENEITALDRKSGEIVWGMDLGNYDVQHLFDVREALVFATNSKNDILVLNSEQKAYEIIQATALSHDENEPVYVIRDILKNGYPHYFDYYAQDRERFADIITPEAAREIGKSTALADSIVHYKNWHFLGQTKDDSTARVDVEVQLTKVTKGQRDILCLKLTVDTLAFHLVQRDSAWVLDLPAPLLCQIDPQVGVLYTQGTPGVLDHLAAPTHSKNKLLFWPNDAWRFKCTSADDCEGEGFMWVNYQQESQEKGKELFIFQEMPCTYSQPEQHDFAADGSVKRTVIIRYDTTRFSIQLSDHDGWGEIEFPLPLRDGDKFTFPGDEGGSCVLHIETESDGEELYRFDMNAPGDIHYAYTISPTRGFTKYYHHNFDIHSEWVLEELRKW